jgi:hypothetical protein
MEISPQHPLKKAPEGGPEIDLESAPETEDSAPMLPLFEEFEPTDGKRGFLESATLKTIEVRTADGWLGPGDSAVMALAIITARKVDRMTSRDAASGQANLLRTMKEVLETMPQPEVAGSSDLGAVLEVIQAEEQGAIDA